MSSHLTICIIFCLQWIEFEGRNLFGCGYGSTVSDANILQHLQDLTMAMGADATGISCSWSDIQQNETSSYNFTICDEQIKSNKNRGFQLFESIDCAEIRKKYRL